MVRISRGDLPEYINNSIASLGGSEMEVRGSQVYQVPQGQSAPTQPDRTPAPSAPKGRTGLGVLGAAVRAACSLYNPSPGGFIDKYLDFSEYTNSTSVADALMRQICAAPPFPPPAGGNVPEQPRAPQAPFLGGQCPGGQYQAFVDADYINTQGQPDNFSGRLFWTGSGLGVGPIVSAKVEASGPSRPESTWILIVTDSVGRTARQSIIVGDFAAPTATFSMVRTDGPDDCGSLPVQPAEDPTFGTPNPLPPFSFDPGDGGDPEVYEPDIAIEPGPSGPQLRFRFPDGDYYVDPGGVDIVRPDSPDSCCPPNSVPPDAEEFQPDPDEGPPAPKPPEVPPEDPATNEEDRVMVAVVVTATSIDTPSTALSSVDGGPTVYAPRLGSLQFRIEAGGGASGWTSDIDIKNAQQYVPVPVPQGAVDVRVRGYGPTLFQVDRIYKAVQSTAGANQS